MEVLLQQRLYKGYYGLMAYTLVRSEYQNPGDDFALQSWVPSSWDNRHIVSFTGGKKWDSGWEVGARVSLQRRLAIHAHATNPKFADSELGDVQRAHPGLRHAQRQAQRGLPPSGLANRPQVVLRQLVARVFADIQNVTAATPPQPDQLDVVRDPATGRPIPSTRRVLRPAVHLDRHRRHPSRPRHDRGVVRQKSEKQPFVTQLSPFVPNCAPLRRPSKFSVQTTSDDEKQLSQNHCVVVVATGMGTAWGQCEADATVYLTDFLFTPNELTISVGQTVAFVNAEGTHNVDGTAASNPVSFFFEPSEGNIEGVCMGTFTFDVPGVYTFTSSVGVQPELGMTGTIIVDAETLCDVMLSFWGSGENETSMRTDRPTPFQSYFGCPFFGQSGGFPDSAVNLDGGRIHRVPSQRLRH